MSKYCQNRQEMTVALMWGNLETSAFETHYANQTSCCWQCSGQGGGGRGGLRSKARHTQNVDGNPLTRTCRSYKYIHSNQSKLCISIKEKVVQCSFSLRSEAKSTDFRLLFDVISCMYMAWMSCFKTHSQSSTSSTEWFLI